MGISCFECYSFSLWSKYLSLSGRKALKFVWFLPSPHWLIRGTKGGTDRILPRMI